MSQTTLSDHYAVRDPRDAALLAHTPIVPVPRYGKLAPLEGNGHRFLVAHDGLYVEVRRPWLHLIEPVSDDLQPEIALPCGTIDPVYEVKFSEEALRAFVWGFVQAAQGALPNECAAWLVYGAYTRSLIYMQLESTSASAGHVTFTRPRLEPSMSLAVDLHSHGTAAAFFSATDDEDDAGDDVKISIVVGNVDRSEPSVKARMCVLGIFRDLDL
jgi:PRTRC genetic system protein A